MFFFQHDSWICCNFMTDLLLLHRMKSYQYAPQPLMRQLRTGLAYSACQEECPKCDCKENFTFRLFDPR